MRAGGYPSRWLSGVAVLLLFFLLWEGGTRLLKIHPGILPPFSMVVQRSWESREVLVSHLSTTVLETLLGFALAFSIAATLAITFDAIPALRRAIFPLLVSFQSVPKVAFAPILVIWLGHGLLPNIVMSALIAFFPLLVSFVAGLDSTSEELETLMDCLAASWIQRFLKARLPSAVPSLMAGCRIGITYAIIGAIVGEFVNPSVGLGYIMTTAAENFDTSLQFAAIVVVGAIGWLLMLAIALIERSLLSRFFHGTRAVEEWRYEVG